MNDCTSYIFQGLRSTMQPKKGRKEQSNSWWKMGLFCQRTLMIHASILHCTIVLVLTGLMRKWSGFSMRTHHLVRHLTAQKIDVGIQSLHLFVLLVFFSLIDTYYLLQPCKMRVSFCLSCIFYVLGLTELVHVILWGLGRGISGHFIVPLSNIKKKNK